MWTNKLSTLWLLLLACGWVLGDAQNPFESLALGAMSVAGSVAETISSGAAVGKDTGFDTSLLSVHSKTAAGYGQAVRKQGEEDSSEEDRRRRRRRDAHQVLHRLKRTPCKWNMMGGGGGGTGQNMDYEDNGLGDDDVEARRRRRARKRAASKRSTRSKSSKSKSKKKKKLYRRRRQTGDPGEMLGQQAQSFSERLQGMWQSVVKSVSEAAQQLQQKVQGALKDIGGTQLPATQP